MLRLPAPASIALVLSASDAVSKGSEHAFCVTFYIRFAMRLAEKKAGRGLHGRKKCGNFAEENHTLTSLHSRRGVFRQANRG